MNWWITCCIRSCTFSDFQTFVLVMSSAPPKHITLAAPCLTVRYSSVYHLYNLKSTVLKQVVFGTILSYHGFIILHPGLCYRFLKRNRSIYSTRFCNNVHYWSGIRVQINTRKRMFAGNIAFLLQFKKYRLPNLIISLWCRIVTVLYRKPHASICLGVSKMTILIWTISSAKLFPEKLNTLSWRRFWTKRIRSRRKALLVS